MPSVNYPFPDPKNAAECGANLAAGDEYERQETEAGDFLDWEAELEQ